MAQGGSGMRQVAHRAVVFVRNDTVVFLRRRRAMGVLGVLRMQPVFSHSATQQGRNEKKRKQSKGEHHRLVHVAEIQCFEVGV